MWFKKLLEFQILNQDLFKNLGDTFDYPLLYIKLAGGSERDS
jgi:hypothetical protein